MKSARGFSRGLNNHPALEGVATETALPGREVEPGVAAKGVPAPPVAGDARETPPRGLVSLLKPPRLVNHGERGVSERTGNAVAAAPAAGL